MAQRVRWNGCVVGGLSIDKVMQGAGLLCECMETTYYVADVYMGICGRKMQTM